VQLQRKQLVLEKEMQLQKQQLENLLLLDADVEQLQKEVALREDQQDEPAQGHGA